MLKIKKVGALGLAVFASSAFMMSVNAEAHYELSNMKAGTSNVTGICEYMMDYSGESPYSPYTDKGKCNFQDDFREIKGQKDFIFTVTGYDLTPDKNYGIYINDEKIGEKTGAQLEAGATFTYTKTYGLENELVIKDSDNNIVKYNYEYQSTPYSYSKMILEFNMSDIPVLSKVEIDVKQEELEAYLNTIVINGKTKINSIDPGDNPEAEFYISAGLESSYGTNKISMYGGYNAPGEGFVQAWFRKYPYIEKEKETTFDFADKENVISEIIQTVSDKFDLSEEEIRSDFSKRFVVKDLEAINYLYNTQSMDDNEEMLNYLINYSSKVHELAENKNIDFIFDPHAGGTDSDFYHMNLGQVSLFYNGIIYDNVGPIGFALTNIIYVPNDTTKSNDAFIAAAKKRISEYLKDNSIEITVGGAITDLNAHEYQYDRYVDNTTTWTNIFDLNDTTDSWFNVKIGDKTYKFFIVADEDEMNVPFVKTIDAKTNVYITTEDPNVPLDSNIRGTKLDKNSDEYKALAKKLNIIQGLAYDLNLYSESLDMYITKLEDGSFKVYIPVDEATTKKKLTAVYIKEDGTLESHPVTFEGNYAVFETDHFSTYALVDAKNPKTGDHLVLYLLVLTASGYALYKARKFN